MPKTGWKYTKQMPNKGSTNMLKKSSASSKIGRTAPQGDKPHLRSQETIKRLKMYATGKAIRNKEGKVVGGSYLMKDRAGDTEITQATGRIAPDRRWFGNTRVVDSKELDTFRKEMAEKEADPYSVVLKRKKLPMGLLLDSTSSSATAFQKEALLTAEPFETTFGTKSRRKRVKLDQFLVSREEEQQKLCSKKKKNSQQPNAIVGGKALSVPNMTIDNDEQGYAALLMTAQRSTQHYEEINNAEGIVPWGRDSDRTKTEGEGIDWHTAKKDDLFLKGQSKRIWGEFFKVVDSSDVILHVIDARNVPGTRCTMIENHIAKNAPHKHLVFILNKIDLVPNWVAKRWVGELSQVRPTIAFHASMTQAFGKGALIALLRQFSKLMSDKKQISCGVIGYPNTGKSSIINTLISRKSCKVAPIPGETKIWQYITLMKRIYLIDCPGVVVDTAGDTEIDSVLKGVVRAERLETPEDFIDAILAKVKREHIAAQYGLPKEDEGTWTTAMDLLEKIALKAGRLRKGGEPDLRSSAITMINDFQRGKLPHYVAPPELKEEEVTPARLLLQGANVVEQDLDAIGEENMNEAVTTEELAEDTDQKSDDASSKIDRDVPREETDQEDEDSSSECSDDLPPVIVAGAKWDNEDAI